MKVRTLFTYWVRPDVFFVFSILASIGCACLGLGRLLVPTTVETPDEEKESLISSRHGMYIAKTKRC